MKVEKEPGLFQTRYILTEKKKSRASLTSRWGANFVGWGKEKRLMRAKHLSLVQRSCPLSFFSSLSLPLTKSFCLFYK